jgi:hypothetical protein
MPWVTTGGSACGLSSALNTASFAYGMQDGTCPTVVSSTSGISFAPGGILSITYLSGLVTIDGIGWASPYNGFSPYEDGNGYALGTPIPYLTNAGPGTSNDYFPSLYMGVYYPIYLGALVATFTDANGNIVGTPFAVGDGPTDVVAPNGASQLQLGINDDNFSDNAGSLSVSVQGSDPPSNPTPEPASLLLIALPLGALTALEYRKRRRGSKYNGA